MIIFLVTLGVLVSWWLIFLPPSHQGTKEHQQINKDCQSINKEKIADCLKLV